MSLDQVTAYDASDDAQRPGPTVVAALAGVGAGWLSSFALWHATPGLVLTQLGLQPPAPQALVWQVGAALPVVAAGLLAGSTDAARWRRQGAWAGLIAGTWMAAAATLPAGIGWALTPMLAVHDSARSEALAAAILPWATSAGVVGALLRASATFGLAVVASLLGAAVGARRPAARRARGLPSYLGELTWRMAIALGALGGVAFAFGIEPLALPVSAAPSGAAAWASPTLASTAWELALHLLAAAAAVGLLRDLWRQPRTAPETPVRATVDGLLLVLLAVAFLGTRLAIGGGLAAWAAPLLPWGLGMSALALGGRPPPPPAPDRAPATVSESLAFAALGVTTPIALTTLLVWPALVRPLAVAPWTAALADETADLPDPRMQLEEASRILSELAPSIVGLVLVLAAATWLATTAAARWTRRAPAASPTGR